MKIKIPYREWILIKFNGLGEILEISEAAFSQQAEKKKLKLKEEIWMRKNVLFVTRNSIFMKTICLLFLEGHGV
jgi:hypothetical protein